MASSIDVVALPNASSVSSVSHTEACLLRIINISRQLGPLNVKRPPLIPVIDIPRSAMWLSSEGPAHLGKTFMPLSWRQVLPGGKVVVTKWLRWLGESS